MRGFSAYNRAVKNGAYDCVGAENGLKIVFDATPDFFDEAILSSHFIHWQPVFDLYQLNNEVVVTVEIAGVETSDFTIYLDKRRMVIDGIRHPPEVLTKDCCTFHNSEISYGRFNRMIDFPTPVEARRCVCMMHKGLLTMRFPIIEEKVIPVEDG